VSPDVKAAAESLARDVRAVFGDRLRAVLVYGRHAGNGPEAANHDDPVHTLVLVERLEVADLDACALLRARWDRAGLATPLVVDRHEFERSLDAFPLEFGAIIARHEVVVGDDPFDGLGVKPDDLRRACEIQARAHLLHLREGYLEAGGDPAAIARLVTASAAPLLALLTSLARLSGEPAPTPGAVAGHANRALGGRAATFEEVLAIEGPGLPTSDAARLFPAYLAAMGALVHYIDRWGAPA
jgi:hypothetical protein